MKRFTLSTTGRFSVSRLLRQTLPIVVAALSLVGTKAAQALDIHPVWAGSGGDSTAAIQAALGTPTTPSIYSRVILDYHSGGWTTKPLYMWTPNQEIWIAGSGSNVGRLVAKWGEFRDTGDSVLIRVMKPGCTINGYANGTSIANGRATVEMRKSDYMSNLNGWYPFSEGRHAISTDFDDVTIKGCNIKNTGGDGIYLHGGDDVVIKDCVVDGAYRNGITVISASDLTIDDCTIKNTNGTSPQAGIDFEPNSGTDVFTNNIISDVAFSNNSGHNITIGLQHMQGTSVTPIGIYFYRCSTTGGAKKGVNLAYCYANGPTGQVYFQDLTVDGCASNGIAVTEWNAGRAKITFNDILLTHCADASSTPPILFTDGSPGPNGEPSGTPGYGANTVGNIVFYGECYVDDYNSAHAAIVFGQKYSSATRWTDITGHIRYRKNYTGGDEESWGGAVEDNVSVTYSTY
jgi:hypothetical protein